MPRECGINYHHASYGISDALLPAPGVIPDTLHVFSVLAANAIQGYYSLSFPKRSI